MQLCVKGLGALILLIAGMSCGGKSAADESKSAASGGSTPTEGGAANLAGSTASGGAASTSGGAASTSGGTGAAAGASQTSTTCPATAPLAGAACSYVGSQCNYALDMCSSAGFVCSNGLWVQQGNNDGAALTCINFSQDQTDRPKDGDSCACRGMLDCTFDECSTNGSVHAVCDNTTWHVATTACSDTPCGTSGLLCKEGEACVVRPTALGGDYQCVTSPCADQAQTLSCDCAASLCHSPSERCMLNSGQVECICDSC